MKIPSTRIKVVGFGEFSAAIIIILAIYKSIVPLQTLSFEGWGGVAEDNYDSACSVHEILQPCPLLIKHTHFCTTETLTMHPRVCTSPRYHRINTFSKSNYLHIAEFTQLSSVLMRTDSEFFS